LEAGDLFTKAGNYKLRNPNPNGWNLAKRLCIIEIKLSFLI